VNECKPLPSGGGHVGPALTFTDVKYWYQMRPDTLVINNMNMTIPGGRPRPNRLFILPKFPMLLSQIQPNVLGLCPIMPHYAD
jgi:hypothetical protein